MHFCQGRGQTLTSDEINVLIQRLGRFVLQNQLRQRTVRYLFTRGLSE